MSRFALLAVLALVACEKKKSDGPGPSSSVVTPGGGGGGGEEYGCAIAIAPVTPPAPTDPSASPAAPVEFEADVHGQPTEAAAHLAAEKAACAKAGAPPDCVRSGQFKMLRGEVKREK